MILVIFRHKCKSRYGVSSDASSGSERRRLLESWRSKRRNEVS